MSALEGYSKEPADGPFVPLREKGGRLLPTPPIGQIRIEEIVTSDRAGLEEIAHLRSVELAQLFKPEVWESMQGKPRNKNVWSLEDRVRIALMLIDGKTQAEIVKAMQPARPGVKEEDLMRTIITGASGWLSDFAKELATTSKKARRNHATLEAGDMEVETKISLLEGKYNMKRAEIFEKPLTPTIRKEYQTLYTLPIGVHVLYRRFFDGADKGTIMDEVEERIGREVTDKDVDTFYSRALTEKAKGAFGLRGRNDSWGK